MPPTNGWMLELGHYEGGVEHFECGYRCVSLPLLISQLCFRALQCVDC